MLGGWVVANHNPQDLKGMVKADESLVQRALIFKIENLGLKLYSLLLWI